MSQGRHVLWCNEKPEYQVLCSFLLKTGARTQTSGIHKTQVGRARQRRRGRRWTLLHARLILLMKFGIISRADVTFKFTRKPEVRLWFHLRASAGKQHITNLNKFN